MSRISIRLRLIIAMALSLVLLAAVGLSSLWFMATVDRATNELHVHWLPAVRLYAETKYTMASHRLRFVRAIYTLDPSERTGVFQAAEEREHDVRDLLALIRPVLATPQERARLAETVSRWETYLYEEQTVVAHLDRLSREEITSLINHRSRLAFDAVNDIVNAGIAAAKDGADRSGAEAVATFDQAMSIVLSIFFCALVLMAVFITLVVRSISRPIAAITDIMHRLAEGDRTVSAARLAGPDEIGRMAAAVGVFRDYLIERDQARAALERSKEDLEDKVEARSVELRQANESLQAEIVEREEAHHQLKAMQDELVRTENLAVIGQLSAGIAHELNQPLAALGALSENAAEFLEAGDVETAKSNLKRIVALVGRMGVLTGQLRSFARRSDGEATEVDIATSVENALALVGHRIRQAGVRVDIAAPDRPALVFANAIRLEQILVNLLGNAIDALAGQPEPAIRVTWVEEEGRVAVEVADNGVGLASGMEETVFEPFFTTKAKGGLGLGLAISADIAKSFNGKLTARGGSGGAVFRLEVPTSGKAAHG
ncbi:MAG: MCP four helix bundle domain-containing protein [Ancalomicrobiaceae bacterium]|nr:MCP four helix bundle domain-containing protein [Ancalomicrobiaceae bacterium]